MLDTVAERGYPSVVVGLEAAHLACADEGDVFPSRVKESQRFHNERNLSDRILPVVACVLHPPEEVHHRDVEDLYEQVLFARVMVVHTWHAHVGELCDRPHACPVVAGGDERLDRPRQHGVDRQGSEHAPVVGGEYGCGRCRAPPLCRGCRILYERRCRYAECYRNLVQPLDRDPGLTVLDGTDRCRTDSHSFGEPSYRYIACDTQTAH